MKHLSIVWVFVLDDMIFPYIIHEQKGYALLEPVPLTPRRTPPAVVDRVDLKRKDGIVYMHNVYAGPGRGAGGVVAPPARPLRAVRAQTPERKRSITVSA